MTIVENLIVLLILSLVFYVSISLSKGLERHYLKGVMIEIQTMMTEAKLLALRYHTRLLLCPTVSGLKCDTSDWNHSLILFYEEPTKKQGVVSEHQIIHVYQPPSDINLQWRGISKKYIRILSNRFFYVSNGTFYISSRSNSKIAVIMYVNRLGRMRF